MPIYEYKCDDCDTILEKIRSIVSADDPVQCENCQGMNARRILSPFFTCSSDGINSKSNSSYISCSGGNCSTCHRYL